MRRFLGLTFLIAILSCSLNIYGQDIRIYADNQNLNTILGELISQYDAQISFNDKQLSKYTFTIDSSFADIKEAVNFLLANLPFQMDVSKGVIIIYEKQKAEKRVSWIINGRIVEKHSLEPLPYSHLIINGKGIISGLNGEFKFSSTDSLFNLKISHLGYYILDTLLNAGSNVLIEMTPAIIGLNEVVITNSLIDHSSQYGLKPGLIKLNQKVANFLPGYGDNSIFNLLRLQPGILAAGEQTNELIIWGSYEGQSKISMDGFTLYGLKNFNDNISSFNPLLAKDIEVFKGGFDAKLGDRVGGIVNVSSKMGNTQQVKFNFVANNMTLNSMIEIPIKKKSSLIIALRNTYYELYDQNDLNFFIQRNSDEDTTNDIDLNIKPDYKFRDINIKYSSRVGKNDDLFYISLYGASDKFSYSIENTFPKTSISKQTSEKNTQFGSSVFYSKRWSNKSSSNFTFALSSINTLYDNTFLVKPSNIGGGNGNGNGNGNSSLFEDKTTDNTLNESSLKIDNSYLVGSKHFLEYGAEIINNRYELKEDTFDVNYLNMSDNSARLNIYAQDKISLGNKTELKPGLRLTHAVLLKKVFADPRLSLSYNSDMNLKINLSWGIYHQYISRASILDASGNYRYIWALADNTDIPVLESFHYVAGLTYSKSNFTFNSEVYFKNTSGLTRYIRAPKYNLQDVFTGKSRSYGIDFLIKHDFKKHSFWVSYTLGKTEELFTYFLDGEYRRAPQDQRHEIKAAGLLNFEPWYFSANYVYGSGFPDYIYNQQQSINSSHNYNRLDVSVIYRFLNRRIKGETGLSIINVLNTQNYKLENFERIPADQTSTINLYAEAIPFTPTIYLKIYL